MDENKINYSQIQHACSPNTQNEEYNTIDQYVGILEELEKENIVISRFPSDTYAHNSQDKENSNSKLAVLRHLELELQNNCYEWQLRDNFRNQNSESSLTDQEVSDYSRSESIHSQSPLFSFPLASPSSVISNVLGHDSVGVYSQNSLTMNIGYMEQHSIENRSDTTINLTNDLDNSENTNLEFDENFGDYVCNICNKHLKTYSTLKQHKIVHSNDRPYECGRCHKRFKRKGTLQKHKLIHGKMSILNRGKNLRRRTPQRSQDNSDSCKPLDLACKKKSADDKTVLLSIDGNHKMVTQKDSERNSSCKKKIFSQNNVVYRDKVTSKVVEFTAGSKNHAEVSQATKSDKKKYFCSKCNESFKHETTFDDHCCIPYQYVNLFNTKKTKGKPQGVGDNV